jgi:hypothetical protein
MSGTPILALSNLQNSIIFDKGTTKLQDFHGVKEDFANILSRLNPKWPKDCIGVIVCSKNPSDTAPITTINMNMPKEPCHEWVMSEQANLNLFCNLLYVPHAHGQTRI